MTITSIGFDGTVNERGMAEIAARASRPVIATADSWLVEPVVGSRQVSIRPGGGYAAFVSSDSDQAVIVDVPVATGTRWYVIVARRDYNTDSVEFLALLAPAAASQLGTVPTWHPALLPEDFASEPGVLVDQALAWAHVNETNNNVRVWDVREVLAPAVRVSTADQVLASSQWPFNATGGAGGTGAARRGQAATVAASATISVDTPTPVNINAYFRWASAANAAGAQFITLNNTQIGPSYHAHNDGYARIPATITIPSARAMLLPGIQYTARLHITAEAAGADRSFAAAVLTIWRA